MGEAGGPSHLPRRVGGGRRTVSERKAAKSVKSVGRGTSGGSSPTGAQPDRPDKQPKPADGAGHSTRANPWSNKKTYRMARSTILAGSLDDVALTLQGNTITRTEAADRYRDGELTQR